MRIADLPAEELRKINAYWRAANYLSVDQIYLYDNPLLRQPCRTGRTRIVWQAGRCWTCSLRRASATTRPAKSGPLCLIEASITARFPLLLAIRFLSKGLSWVFIPAATLLICWFGVRIPAGAPINCRVFLHLHRMSFLLGAS